MPKLKLTPSRRTAHYASPPCTVVGPSSKKEVDMDCGKERRDPKKEDEHIGHNSKEEINITVHTHNKNPVKDEPESSEDESESEGFKDVPNSSEKSTKSQEPKQGVVQEFMSKLPEENRNNLTCPHCTSGKKYSSIHTLYRHIKQGHEPVTKPFNCESCDQSYRSEYLLKKHVERVHSGLRHLCPYCPKVYAQANMLTYHIRTHTKEKLEVCPECSKSFPQKKQLIRHMEIHKTASADTCVVCPDCGKSFRDKFLLQHHQFRLHKKIEYQCEICDKSFKQRTILRDHMELHKDDWPWRCVICFRRFKLQLYMWRHMKTVHDKRIKEARQLYEKFSTATNPIAGQDAVYYYQGKKGKM